MTDVSRRSVRLWIVGVSAGLFFVLGAIVTIGERESMCIPYIGVSVMLFGMALGITVARAYLEGSDARAEGREARSDER
jgi:hypothetical protein